ncbi:KLRG1 protein, partial [Atractosteus spatula]|nr:KLRG1 protein [Atractosteus spatula]
MEKTRPRKKERHEVPETHSRGKAAETCRARGKAKKNRKRATDRERRRERKGETVVMVTDDIYANAEFSKITTHEGPPCILPVAKQELPNTQSRCRRCVLCALGVTVCVLLATVAALGAILWNSHADWDRRLGEKEKELERYRGQGKSHWNETERQRMECARHKNALESAFCLDVVSWKRKEQCCPEGWKGGDSGRCYYVSTDRRSWESAKQFCSSVGAQLVVIENKKEMELLKTLIHGYDYWMGLRRKDSGGWSWVDGRALNTTVGTVSAGRSPGDCVSVFRSRDGISLSSAVCSTPLHWICEGGAAGVWQPPLSALRS